MIAINHTETTSKAATGKALSFRWTYIVLPLGILAISVILTAWFYHLLPAETAYHFSDGTPDKWTSRSSILAWLLIPQILFSLLAAAIVWGTVNLGRRFQQTDSTALKPILSIMGNMVALPQIILCFAMLDIFSYNAYQIHLFPLWIFTVLVMAVGGIILIAFFLQAIRRVQVTKGFKEQK